MSAGPVYVLDSDVFMTAARSYYAFDLVPAFWDGLVREAKNGRLLSIDRVKAEIDEGKDRLKEWATNEFHPWFVPTDSQTVVTVYASIIAWGMGEAQFTPAAKAEFADEKNADPWLVAYAKATNSTVVTNETYDAYIRRKIKIPNMCKAADVAYIDLFQMLRALGFRLS